MAFNLKSAIITRGNSWSVPTGVTAAWVLSTAPGGGGCGSPANVGSATGCSAAASGEFCAGALIPITGPTFTPTIGTGGAGTSGNLNPQTAGGNTVFGPHQLLGPAHGTIGIGGPQFGGGVNGGADSNPPRNAAFPDIETNRFCGGYGATHVTTPVDGFGADTVGGAHGTAVAGVGPGNGGSGNIFQSGGIGGNGKAGGNAATGYGAGGGGAGSSGNPGAATTGGGGQDGVVIVFWIERP